MFFYKGGDISPLYVVLFVQVIKKNDSELY